MHWEIDARKNQTDSSCYSRAQLSKPTTSPTLPGKFSKRRLNINLGQGVKLALLYESEQVARGSGGAEFY